MAALALGPGPVEEKEAGGQDLSRPHGVEDMLEETQAVRLGDGQGPGVQEELPDMARQRGEQARPVVLVGAGQGPQLAGRPGQGGVFAPQQGQDVMAHPVAGAVRGLVGGVFAPGGAQGQQEVAQLGFFPVQQGAQQAARRVGAGHAAKAGPARAAQQAHDDVLGQVVGVVGGHDPVAAMDGPHGFQERVAQLPGALLNAGAAARKGRGDIQAGRLQRDAQAGAHAPGMLQFHVGFGPQAVMGVGRDDGQVQPRGQQGEDVQQGRGVQARGVGRHQPRPCEVRTEGVAAEARHAQAAPGQGAGQVLQAHGGLRGGCSGL